MSDTLIDAVLSSLFVLGLILLWRRVWLGSGRDSAFWGLLGGTVLLSGSLAGREIGGHWNAGLTAELWVGLAATLTLFAGVARQTAQGWRLSVLLLPYAALLGTLAVSLDTPSVGVSAAVPDGWLYLHILVAVATVGLFTLAAVAALAGTLQAQALKTKQPTRLTRLLPPVAESERLGDLLLILAQGLLGTDLLTGVTLRYLEAGQMFHLDHKTLLSLLAFLLIGLLLIGRRICGVRGKAATRVVLASYLFLLLGFFGVKFVHQVLMAGALPG